VKKILLIILVIYINSAFADVSNYNFPRTLNFNKDQWSLASQDESPRTITAEYITHNESPNNWSQLFTYQQMVKPLPENITPRDVANHIEANLKQKGIHYEFRILSASDDEALIEFRITEPELQQQDELQRIIKTKKGIYILMHYVKRQVDMGMHVRNTWIANLKSMPIIIF
jgi:hypothetical protein